MAVSKKNETGVTLLTEEQIWGDAEGKGQLQVMKSYGTKTGMSDLAIVLGGFMGRDKTSDGQRAGAAWSASSVADGCVRYVRDVGDRFLSDPDQRLVGARPALPSSITSKIKPSDARLTKKLGGIQVVEYDEYPQTIAPKSVSKQLESELLYRQIFSSGQLKTTGKKYTFDGEETNAYEKPFKAKEYAEYCYKGKRYIHVKAKPYDGNSVLSNGKLPKKGEACWIEVQPIEWKVEPDKIMFKGKTIDNPNAGLWLARQILFAGIQFDRKKSYDGNFAATDMHHYLQNYFAKEMQPSPGADKHVDSAPVGKWAASAAKSTITDLATGASAELQGGRWVDTTAAKNRDGAARG